MGRFFVGTGLTPYRRSCGLSRAGGMNLANIETDPRLSVDHSGRPRLQLSFMQDPVVGIRSAFSDDLGGSWRIRDPKGLSPCFGGHGNTFGDQDIAAGAAGVVGLVYINGNLVTGRKHWHPQSYAFDGAVRFSRSVDGGETWADPVTISAGGVYQHTAMVVADPRNSGVFYAGWATIPNPAGMLPRPPHLAEGFVYLARSSDGGATWSAPVAMAPGYQLWDLKLFDDGVLVAFVDGDQLVRSSDGGQIWEKPHRLPVSISNTALYAFADGQVMAGDFPLAVGPAHQLYFVASTQSPGTGGALAFLRSDDEGLTWSDPVIVTRNATGVFHATIAADASGRLVAMWYDLREDNAGDGKLTTAVHVAWSLDDGKTWADRAVSRSFDMNSAPMLFGARYLGNYQAILAVRPGLFVGVYAVAPPVARRGRADLQSFRLEFASRSEKP